MKFPDLRSFLKELESAGELFRVSQELSPRYEVAAAIKLIAEIKDRAVLCEKVTGYSIPVVGNLLGSMKRLAMALNVGEEHLGAAYTAGRAKPVKPEIIKRAPVQEVVLKTDIDIMQAMPVLLHHEKDAGPYMTSAFVAAKDPETGIRGQGIHRINIKGKDKLGIFLGSPPLSNFLAKATQQNRPLEVAIVSGADPVTYFASPQSAPQGIDKYDIAGGLAGAPLELVKCLSVDVEVPARAEFIMEGYILPGNREKEGPFGETTGYYLTYNNPVAVIKTITHRTNPVYHALVPFGPEEQVLMFPQTQVDLVARLRVATPSVQKVYSPYSGVVYVQINKQTEEDAKAIINALFLEAKAPYAKVIVVVDADVDIQSPREIAWALSTRLRPDRNIIIKSGQPGLAIDPSAELRKGLAELGEVLTVTGKVGIDATKPLAELDKFAKIDVPAQVRRKVASMLRI